jgi:hypothetical protein
MNVSEKEPRLVSCENDMGAAWTGEEMVKSDARKVKARRVVDLVIVAIVYDGECLWFGVEWNGCKRKEGKKKKEKAEKDEPHVVKRRCPKKNPGGGFIFKQRIKGKHASPLKCIQSGAIISKRILVTGWMLWRTRMPSISQDLLVLNAKKATYGE